MKTEQTQRDAATSTSELMGKLSDFLAAENVHHDVAINAMINLAFNAVLAAPAMWPGFLSGQEVLREMLLERSGGNLHRVGQVHPATDALSQFTQRQQALTDPAHVDRLAALTIELQTWLKRKQQPLEAQLDALLSMYVSIVNAHPEYRKAARNFGDVLHEIFAETPSGASASTASPLTH